MSLTSPIPTGHDRFARLATVGLGIMLCISATASLYASWAAHTFMPTSDSWEHTALIAHALQHHIDLPSLWQRHNDVHFIPLPKLVYALDLAWTQGSGWLVSGMAWSMVLVCCLAWSRLVCRLLQNRWQRVACLLTCGLLLTSAMQMESLVNPANLQWACLAAGISVSACALLEDRRTSRFALLATGMLLALCSGGPWYLLLAAILLAFAGHLPRYLATAMMGMVSLLAWDLLNAFTSLGNTPLPIMLYRHLYPLSEQDVAQYSATLLADPLGFYRQWGTGILQFFSSYLHPALERITAPHSVVAAAMLQLGLLFFRTPTAPAAHKRPLVFVLAFTMLTGLAIAVLRSPLDGGYTPRFANLGMLSLCASFLWLFMSAQGRWQSITLVLSLIYGAAQLTANLQEAAGTLQGSNHKRLSQVAYSLDVQDIRTTAENPFGPTLQEAFTFLEQHKTILREYHAGIYGSAAYRIYAGNAQLPTKTTPCVYRDIKLSHHTDDPAIWYLQGFASDPQGHSLHQVIFSHSSPVGYGIAWFQGDNLWQQMTQPVVWAGFARMQPSPASGQFIDVVAYNDEMTCQPHTVALPNTIARPDTSGN